MVSINQDLHFQPLYRLILPDTTSYAGLHSILLYLWLKLPMHNAAAVRFGLQSTIYCCHSHITAPTFYAWKSALGALLLVRLIPYQRNLCCLFQIHTFLLSSLSEQPPVTSSSFHSNSYAVSSTGSSSIRWLW